MIDFIFGSLQESSDAVKSIQKTLQGQARLNRSVAAFAMVMAAYTIVAGIRNYEQNKKIEKLSNEIKELKHMEGE